MIVLFMMCLALTFASAFLVFIGVVQYKNGKLKLNWPLIGSAAFGFFGFSALIMGIICFFKYMF